jgi:hypothetical protein
MTQFPDLPTELRHNILEHVITVYAYLDLPNVDAQQPEEWICPKPTYPPGYTGGYPPAVPIIRHFRRVPNAARILPLLLVSKAFARDARYVWSQMVEPTLIPTLNVDCVGHGITNYRPLVGILTKWLYLPKTFQAAEQIELRVRLLDHRVMPEGASLGHDRILEPRIPGELQPQLLGLGLSLVMYMIQMLTFPSIAEYPTEDFAGVKTLKVVFDTGLAVGLHWSVSGISLQYENPEAKYAVSLHPAATAGEIAYHLTTLRAQLQTALPLETCELYVGDALVKKVHGLRGPDSEMEWFPWDTPHDPIFRRQPMYNPTT